MKKKFSQKMRRKKMTSTTRTKKKPKKDMSDNKQKVRGVVEECLPDLKFRIILDTGREILGYTSGKMKLNKIKVLVGDKVEVELDPYGGKATNRVTRRL